MQLISKYLPKDCKIILASDFHEGNSMQHPAGIKALVDYVKSTKNIFVMLGGDLIEAICVDDKRYSSFVHQAMPIEQCKNIVEKLKPIADRILFVLEGNHEWVLTNKIGNIIEELICKPLGEHIPYGTLTTKFSILDSKGRVRNKVFYTHGFRGRSISSVSPDPTRRIANEKYQLKTKLQHLAGDCAVMALGHYHKLIIAKPEEELYLIDNQIGIKACYTKPQDGTGYIDPNLRWYCCTGSFLKLYGELGVSGYGELFGYAPTELGYCEIDMVDYNIADIRKVII